MAEITGHPQNTIITRYLFLPQVYWLLIRNADKPRVLKYLTDPNFVPNWERKFLDDLVKLSLLPSDSSTVTAFWDSSVSLKLMDQVKNSGVFDTKAKVQNWLRNNASNLLNLYRQSERLDRKTIPAAEAIGLIAYHDSPTRIPDDSPTELFYSLFESEEAAAVLLLSRILSIPEPSFENVKVTTRQMLSDHFEHKFDEKSYLSPPLPSEHPKATLNALLAPFEHWMGNTLPVEDFNKIRGFLRSLPSLVPMTAWRHEIPSKSYLSLVRSLMENRQNPSSDLAQTHPQNIILVGPPGTGKTYCAQQLARSLAHNNNVEADFSSQLISRVIENLLPLDSHDSINIFMTQFHPSISYEDFVEGLRPVPTTGTSGNIRYSVVPGILKASGQLARAYWERFREPDGACYSVPLQVFRSPKDGSITIPKEYSLYRFSERLGEIHFSEEGGQTLLIASTSENSIEPRNQDKISDSNVGLISAFWTPKNVTKCPNFVLIVDELNRGNPTKVFGELLMLLEKSKRLGWPSAEAKPILLPYSKEEFILPLNFHVICTMNQADKSLAMIDQAFKRRFVTRYIKPNFELIDNCPKLFPESKQEDEQITRRVTSHIRQINEALKEIEINSDKHIGHYYALETLRAIFVHEISVNLAVERLWREHIQHLIRDIVPPKDVEDFANAFNNLQKKNPTFIIKSLMEMLTNPSEDIMVAA